MFMFYPSSREGMHLYLQDFDFRYNHRIALGCDDATRAALAVKGIAGKRLTYRLPHNSTSPAASA